MNVGALSGWASARRSEDIAKRLVDTCRLFHQIPGLFHDRVIGGYVRARSFFGGVRRSYYKWGK